MAVGARAAVAVGGTAGVRLGLSVWVGSGVPVGTNVGVTKTVVVEGTGVALGAAQDTSRTASIKQKNDRG